MIEERKEKNTSFRLAVDTARKKDFSNDDILSPV